MYKIIIINNQLFFQFKAVSWDYMNGKLIIYYDGIKIAPENLTFLNTTFKELKYSVIQLSIASHVFKISQSNSLKFYIAVKKLENYSFFENLDKEN